MSLVEEARDYRKRILAADADTSTRLVRSYAAVARRIDAELTKLQAAMERDGATLDRLRRSDRLVRLRALVIEQIGRFGQGAQLVIGGAIDTARELGSEGALRLVSTATPPPMAPVALPTSTVESAVAAFRSQAVRAMLAPLAEQAARAVEDAVVSGLARGAHPRTVASEIRRHLGGNLIRALTISRTEMMRAHREGALETYQANADVIAGWTWVAGLGSRTCPSCWAQHGSVHPVDEPMASHPRCRCVAVPKTRSWRELGFPSGPEPQDITPGPVRFARQSERVQLAVLGPSKLEAYQRGQVGLEDFIARRTDPRWGPSTRAAGLAEARSNAQARRSGAAQAA